MNNTLYLERNPHVDMQLKKLTETQGLVLCYRNRKQRIFKNEKVLVAENKKYIFLRVFSEDDSAFFSKIYEHMIGAHSS